MAFGPLYDGWFGADRYQPDYARAGIEHAITFAVELGVYWFDPSQNVVDWQFPNLGSKLTSCEGFRFDDNLPANQLPLPLFRGLHALCDLARERLRHPC